MVSKSIKDVTDPITKKFIAIFFSESFFNSIKIVDTIAIINTQIALKALAAMNMSILKKPIKNITAICQFIFLAIKPNITIISIIVITCIRILIPW